ncbi:Actin cytoskeleton-regulatory complex PAN1 [Gossypium arboreum]|uniref:Actin cytoskeleton-regulatory complex PAN1 n=1 Tax=Gossypium arboreum TaxID=29729 RepID=A0A0B0N2N4_GOSAR|nr:Actin cytoskeleton-regulatory complex PAN1 [Gossypium arboreum]
MATNRALEPEIGPDGLAREAPVIAYTEKIIEEERVQLKKYIEENYSKIRDVERELANLTMEMKLTAGPKKAALEHMRKKIEMSTERIRIAKQKEEQARKVQESSNSQFARLEELKRRLEALNPSRASALSSHDVKAIGLIQGAATVESSSVSQTTDLRPTFSDNVPNLGNGGNVPAMKLHHKLPTDDGELKGTKKSHFHGRGKGIGAVPKGSGSIAPGWTGAGFDVDGRT